MRLRDYDHGRRYVATLLDSQRLTPEGSIEVRELRLELAVPDFRAAALVRAGLLTSEPVCAAAAARTGSGVLDELRDLEIEARDGAETRG